jgi:hypothetical protein
VRISGSVLVQASEDAAGDLVVVILDESTGNEVVVPSGDVATMIGALEYFAPGWDLDLLVESQGQVRELSAQVRAVRELCGEARRDGAPLTVEQVLDALGEVLPS